MKLLITNSTPKKSRDELENRQVPVPSKTWFDTQLQFSPYCYLNDPVKKSICLLICLTVVLTVLPLQIWAADEYAQGPDLSVENVEKMLRIYWGKEPALGQGSRNKLAFVYL